MSILCVIPVRGGSRGLPGKNIRLLGGHPLVAWTIQAALEAEEDLHVVVSTDSAEIAEVALRYGADVPGLRPAHLAQDSTPTEPVIEHVLAAERAAGVEPEGVMLLQATSPLRLPGTLDRAVRQFRDTGVDSLVGVVPVSPFLWRHAEDPDGEPIPDFDVTARKRRQDMTGTDLRFRENGSLYVTRPWVYDRLHNRLGGRIGLLELDDLEGVDIDTELDFALADAVQHQRVLPARLAQHRGHQAAGKQALQGNPKVVIGTEAVIRPRGPQGEQAALSGQGQQGAGGSDQDLPVRLCRHQRGGGLPQPGGKQVAGKENAIWRADRPGCHLPRLPFAKQQPPAVSLVLPGLQHPQGRHDAGRMAGSPARRGRTGSVAKEREGA